MKKYRQVVAGKLEVKTKQLEHEIDERKLAEKALMESETHYCALFEYSPISLWEEDFSDVKQHIDELRASGVSDFRAYFDEHPEEVGGFVSAAKIIRVNQATLDLFKADSKDHLSQGLNVIFSKGSFDIFREALITFAGGDTQFQCETVLKSLADEKLITIVRFFIAPGHINTWGKVFLSVSDISELKQIEEKLKFTNLLLSTEQASIDGILVVDENARILLYNHMFIQMWGLPEKLVEQEADEPVLKFVTAQLLDPQSFLQKVQYLYEHKQETSREEIILSDDRVFDRYSTPMFGADNRYYGRVWYFRDITERKQAENALRINEERYREAQAIGHAGNWEYNLQTNHFWGSEEAKHIYGFDREAADFSIDEVEHCIPERERVHQALVDLIEANKPYNLEFEIYPKNSLTPRIISSIAELKRDEHGSPLLVTGVIQDITERKNSEENLLKNERRYKAITQTSMDGFWVTDTKGHILEVNDAYCEISGYSRETLLSMNVSDLVYNETKDEIAVHIKEIIKKGYDKFGGSHLRIDGTILNVQNRVTYIEKEKLFICFFNDITERIKREGELKYLGYHDILTGLYNRTFFEGEIKRLDVDRQLPLSVIVGDINGLKLINDSFGHDIGDKTIVEVANIIKRSCREEDIIARVGGDEFCILLLNSNEEIAQRICKRIYNKCEQNKNSGPNEVLFISISLGHANRTAAHESIEVLMRDAEAAMYRHKLLETRSLRSSVVSSIISTLKERYIETEAHSERMKKLCRATGTALHMPDSMLDDLELLAALHDIGKISINDTVINKQTKLTNEEMGEIRRHTEIGYNITQSTIEFQRISEYILAHHEKWDGSGYPRKIQGEEIPLLSRIIAVVDAYDAMTNDRPYRKALSQEYAINEIKACAGTQFDPKIARIFIEKVLKKEW